MEDLASYAGTSVSNLGLIERGVTKCPQRATVERIAEALQVSIDELCPEEQKTSTFRPGYVPRFAACRKATGHSREEAARRLKLRESTLANYENCSAYPPAWLVLQMAELYGVTCDFLLGATPSKYNGRFCRIVYCEAGLPHDRCCTDCPDREGCEYRCENSPETCNCCRTKRPDEMMRTG